MTEDHENAKILAKGLAEIDGIAVEPVETNIIFSDVAGLGMTAEAFNNRLKTHGVRVSALGPTRARAVTHLDVSRSQTEEALDIIRGVAAETTILP